MALLCIFLLSNAGLICIAKSVVNLNTPHNFQISSFSGDPSRVTLYGSGSAGGKSALLHLASKANRGRGLFHRVVAHSGFDI